MWIYALIYLAIINVITFITYGIDKRKAVKDKYRISEKTLIMLAVFGGSIGAFAAMKKFKHKTKHLKFKLGVPFIFIMQVAALVALYVWVL